MDANVAETQSTFEEIDRKLSALIPQYIEQKLKNISGSSLEEKLGSILKKSTLEVDKVSYEIGKDNRGFLAIPIDVPMSERNSVENFANEAGIKDYSPDTHDLEAVFGGNKEGNRVRVVDVANQSSTTFKLSKELSEKLSKMLVEKIVEMDKPSHSQSIEEIFENQKSRKMVFEAVEKLLEDIIPISEDVTKMFDEEDKFKIMIASAVAEHENKIAELTKIEKQVAPNDEQIKEQIVGALKQIHDSFKDSIKTTVGASKKINEAIGKSIKNKVDETKSNIQNTLNFIKEKGGSIKQDFLEKVKKVKDCAINIAKFGKEKVIEPIGKAAGTIIATSFGAAISGLGFVKQSFEDVFKDSSDFLINTVKDAIKDVSNWIANVQKAEKNINASLQKIKDNISLYTSKEGLISASISAITYLADNKNDNPRLAKADEKIRSFLTDSVIGKSANFPESVKEAVKNAIDCADEIARLRTDVSKSNNEIRTIIAEKVELEATKESINAKLLNINKKLDTIKAKYIPVSPEMSALREDFKNAESDSIKSQMRNALVSEITKGRTDPQFKALVEQERSIVRNISEGSHEHNASAFLGEERLKLILVRQSIDKQIENLFSKSEKLAPKVQKLESIKERYENLKEQYTQNISDREAKIEDLKESKLVESTIYDKKQTIRENQEIIKNNGNESEVETEHDTDDLELG